MKFYIFYFCDIMKFKEVSGPYKSKTKKGVLIYSRKSISNRVL